MNEFVWFKPSKTGVLRTRLDEIIFLDEAKIDLQRELGRFMGVASTQYETNPQQTLETLDKFYETARDGLYSAAVSDTWSLMYFRAILEIVVNYTQNFRVMHNLPPSQKINADSHNLNCLKVEVV